MKGDEILQEANEATNQLEEKIDRGETPTPEECARLLNLHTRVLDIALEVGDTIVALSSAVNLGSLDVLVEVLGYVKTLDEDTGTYTVKGPEEEAGNAS